MTEEKKDNESWQPGQEPEKQDGSAKATTAAQPAEVQPTEYEKGCCGAAWKDVRSSKGWFGKVFLLALIDFVPILNWVASGYALRWARQLFFGKVEDMPKKIFGDRTFVTGAMLWVVTLVVGIVTCFVACILGYVPFIGALLGICVVIFVDMVMNFCYLRMTIFDQLGEGFSVNKGWKAMKKQVGKALCIQVLPSVIIGLIVSVIFAILISIFFSMNGQALFSEWQSLFSKSGAANWNAFLQVVNSNSSLQKEFVIFIGKYVGAATPFIFIGLLFANMGSALNSLIEFRAVGHYITRYCQEWKQEPKFDVVLQCEER
jgi:hypothetical protein